jgi:hypothetical protein
MQNQEDAIPLQECVENPYCHLYKHANYLLFGLAYKKRLLTHSQRLLLRGDQAESTERKVSVSVNVQASRVHDVLTNLVWRMLTV